MKYTFEKNDEYLAHWGVKGMKWRKRKQRDKHVLPGTAEVKKRDRLTKRKKRQLDYEEYLRREKEYLDNPEKYSPFVRNDVIQAFKKDKNGNYVPAKFFFGIGNKYKEYKNYTLKDKKKK